MESKDFKKGEIVIYTGELKKHSVIANFATTAAGYQINFINGTQLRNVQKMHIPHSNETINFFNLDLIRSIGSVCSILEHTPKYSCKNPMNWSN